MKRRHLFAAAIGIPLFFLALAWQSGRFAALAAEAKRVEAAQKTWLEENRKLDASIRVLSSRERADEGAEELGLEKAPPERRLHIEGGSSGGGK